MMRLHATLTSAERRAKQLEHETGKVLAILHRYYDGIGHRYVVGRYRYEGKTRRFIVLN